MADQGRWFKVWTSILDDLDFQDCSLEDIGRWALTGAMAKLTGTSGSLRVSGTGRRLCQVLRVESLTDAKRALARLPNVILSDGPVHWPHGHDKPPVYEGHAWAGYRPLNGRGSHPFEEWCTRHDAFTVTFKNWRKYQEDTTAAERGRALRSKRRREERRGEETRRSPQDASHLGPPTADWPEALHEVRQWLATHNAPPQLLDPVYWQRIEDWLGAPDSGVGYLDELAKYLAWLAAQPRSRGHVDLKRGFRNWLAKSEYWSQTRAQTQAVRKSR